MHGQQQSRRFHNEVYQGFLTTSKHNVSQQPQRNVLKFLNNFKKASVDSFTRLKTFVPNF